MSHVTNLFEKLKSWLEENAPELLATLAKGASEQKIAALETTLGQKLPDDYREFLGLCNGQKKKSGFGFYEGKLLSIDDVTKNWSVWVRARDDGRLEGWKGKPEKGIRKDFWNPAWIPFTRDDGGNNLCLDMDPAKSGTVGQVITMWHDTEDRSIRFSGFTAWLENILSGLESEEIVFDLEDYCSLVSIEDLNV
jgi:cell wall assembly regulator SMI1